MLTTEAEIRDFLLGRTPEEQRESIETQTLEDEDFHLTVCSIEDDLFDAYARGELDGKDRDAFLRRYGHQASRLRFANALASRGSNVVPFPARRWIGLTAAAAIAVIVVAALIVRSSRTTTVETTRRVAPILRTMAVTVTLGGSRSASAGTQLQMARNVTTVELRVRLNPNDRYDQYTIELRSNGVHWSASNLHAITVGGDLVIAAIVPANVFQNGTYELAVSGGTEPLGFLTMEVHRTR